MDAPSRARVARRPPVPRVVEGARTAVSQLRLTDPDRAAFKSAARAAIVMPAVFAVAHELIGDPQTSLFAAFGSFAILVLVDFAGPIRSRFIAYVTLACAGAASIVLGTFCSRNAWLAAGAMAVVGFGILFSGVINGYFAAATTSALLMFILPVTLRVPFSEVPARLEGWALAAGFGICAHMLLWPARPRATLRVGAALACEALADLAEPEPRGDGSVVAGRAREAVHGLRRGFLGRSLPANRPDRTDDGSRFPCRRARLVAVVPGPQGDLPLARSLSRGERRGPGRHRICSAGERRDVARRRGATGFRSPGPGTGRRG